MNFKKISHFILFVKLFIKLLFDVNFIKRKRQFNESLMNKFEFYIHFQQLH
jgi:hypothetical protein